MSSLAKAFLALVTLSLVAVAVGLASWSDEPPPDRSRPVIIGRTGGADDDRTRGGDDRPRPEPTPRQEEDPGSEPSVVTPKPRELDDAGDGDQTDPGEDGRDDDTSEDTSEDVDDDEGDDGGDDGGDD